MRILSKIMAFVLAVAVLAGCSSSDKATSPVDELIKSMEDKKNFTIILYDMDIEGSLSETYKHKYKIITPPEDTMDSLAKPKEKKTKWYEVSERFFNIHAKDMGMEIAAKVDGKVRKQTAPPGYSNYVGNSQYGQWKTNNSGNSFWAFYGQYAFMSNMIGLMNGPVYRSNYRDYRSNYRGVRPYYGSGSRKYGTFSSASKKMNPSFHQRVKNNSNFKSRVNNSVSRSSSARKSRSGSRYSSGSRSRSSSSGGK